MSYDIWLEYVTINRHMPRKKRYAVCSYYRNNKVAVHRTVNGKGLVARLIAKENKNK